jgi:hypothetical protein
MAFYVSSSKLGVDLNNTSATQGYTLGEVCSASDGSMWQYVCADSTVSAYSVVVVNQSGTMHMAVLGDVNAGAGNFIAVAQNIFAPNEYGWVPIHGTGGQSTGFKVKVSASVTLGVTLYLATSSGNLSSTAAASATMKGIALSTASAVAGVTTYACVLTWPKVNTLGT